MKATLDAELFSKYSSIAQFNEMIFDFVNAGAIYRTTWLCILKKIYGKFIRLKDGATGF